MALRPLRIFFCYSHKDRDLREELEKHIAPLRRQGLVETWHDQRISAGDVWEQQIEDHLGRADIVLLLISADFLHSEYCTSKELQNALARHEKGLARVIPVILRPVDWHAELFSKLQALPTDGRAVTTWKNQDEAWFDIATGVRKTVQEQIKKNGDLALDNARLQNEVEQLKAELASKAIKSAAEKTAAASPRAHSVPETLSPEAESLEIRKAYRRIYSFQRRTFDLLTELSDTFGSLNFTFERWDPVYSGRPAKSTTEFFRKTHWAWDFLPAYRFECSWSSVNKGEQSRHIIVDVGADTGWQKKRPEPDPMDFLPVSDSRTLIGVSLLRSNNPEMTWHTAWTEVLSKQHHIFDGNYHTFPLGSASITYRNFAVDLHELIGKNEVQERIVTPIHLWLKESDMTAPPAIRILPMGKELSTTYEAAVNFLSGEMKLRKGRYYYRSSAMVTEEGTLVLFQYDGCIVAHAVMVGSSKEVSVDRLAEGYGGYYLFEPTSIKVYTRPLSQAQLNQIWPNVVLSQAMHKLDPSMYPHYQQMLLTIGA